MTFQAKQEVFFFLLLLLRARSFPIPVSLPLALSLAVRRSCIAFPPNSSTSYASDNTLIEISLPTSTLFFFLFFFIIFYFIFFFSALSVCECLDYSIFEDLFLTNPASLTMSRFLMGCIVSANSSQQNGVGTK